MSELYLGPYYITQAFVEGPKKSFNQAVCQTVLEGLPRTTQRPLNLDALCILSAELEDVPGEVGVWGGMEGERIGVSLRGNNSWGGGACARSLKGG